MQKKESKEGKTKRDTNDFDAIKVTIKLNMGDEPRK